MDLWVVAAVAGAGYIAKHWQNFPWKGSEDELSSPSDSFFNDPLQLQSHHYNSKHRKFLHHIKDQTCPLSKLAPRYIGTNDGVFVNVDRDVGNPSTSFTNDVEKAASSGNYSDFNLLSLGSIQASVSGNENVLEFEEGVKEKSELGDRSVEHLRNKEGSNFHGLNRRKNFRIRSHGYQLKPLNSLESCFSAQLYNEHARIEKDMQSSFASSTKSTVRPLLVTDGSRVIGRASSDLRRQSITGEIIGRASSDLRRQSITGEIIGRASNDFHRQSINGDRIGKPSNHFRRQSISGERGIPIESLRTQKQYAARRKSTRLSITSERAAGEPLPSQGPPNCYFALFLGWTIGMMSAFASNKREVDNLKESLRQAKNLIQDLQDEIEMKDSLTVQEINTEGDRIPRADERDSVNGTPAASPEIQPSEIENQNHSQPDNQEFGKSNEMGKIEAELEAELERLGLNMRTSNMEHISDIMELDSDMEFDVTQGDLKVDNHNWQHELPSNSDQDTSDTTENFHQTPNYAVSPRELSLRLHEVLQSRLQARILELEMALQRSQKKLHSVVMESATDQGELYGEVESASLQGSPTFIEEFHDYEINEPMLINLTGNALDAYNEAFEEISRMNEVDEGTLQDQRYNNDHIEAEKCPSEEIPGQTSMDKVNVEYDNGEERIPSNFIRENLGLHEEWTPRSWGSNNMSDHEEDDEMRRVLIKQIVEKARQGSSAIMKAQRLLCSVDEDR